jgi:hypothetical protein
MKRTIFLPALLLIAAAVVSGQTQAGHGGQESNLKGLSGVRLIVMFGRADGLEEAQRPEVLKMLEADTTAKLQTAGIPLLKFNDEIDKAGSPQLVVMVTLDIPNGYVNPIVTEVKLLQRVRLARDSSIELDAATWSAYGVGNKLDFARIRRLVATNIDQFIRDFRTVNSKETVQASQ